MSGTAVHYRYSVADAATMCGEPLTETWVTSRHLVTCKNCLIAIDARQERVTVRPGGES